jgi:hypothetical protein
MLTPRSIVTLPPSSRNGTITALVTGVEPLLHVEFFGEGDGWRASGQGLHVKPGTIDPVHYQLTVELDSSSFSLIGAQIYRETIEDVNTHHATIFLPALWASNQLVINLLNGIHNSGNGVHYKFFIGLINNNTGNIFWPDPTIEFEPESGPPPVDDIDEQEGE